MGAHDQVFTTQSGRALRVDTVRSLVNSFLSSVPDSVVDERWKSHSLRSMSQSALQLCGVPRDHINIRGGWTSRLESATVARHYVHFRLVPGTLPICSCFPGIDSILLLSKFNLSSKKN